MAQTWDNAVTRAAAWFLAEPPTLFPTAPPLKKAVVNGVQVGHFDSVQAYRPRDIPRNGRHLYIYRDYRQHQGTKVTEMGEVRSSNHKLLCHILWGFDAASRKAEDNEAALEKALAAIITRINGPFGDKTHRPTVNDAGFNDAGDENDEPDVEFLGDPRDAILAGEQVEVLVTYGANDFYTD